MYRWLSVFDELRLKGIDLQVYRATCKELNGYIVWLQISNLFQRIGIQDNKIDDDVWIRGLASLEERAREG